jgi:hypothetical protein
MTLLVLCLLVVFQGTMASHFAFGTLSWERDVLDETKIHFSLQQALRYSYFGFGSVTLGETETYNFGRFTCEPYTCADDATQATFLKWSDSGRKYHNSADERPPRDCLFLDDTDAYIDTTVNTVVQIVYEDDDYFTGTWEYTFDIPQWEYPGWDSNDAEWHCYFYSYARVTDLAESNYNSFGTYGDLGMTLSTIIVPGVDASPYSVGLPREYAAVNKTWTFTVPADTTTGSPLHYRIAAGFDVEWDDLQDMWLWDDSTTWKNKNANLRTIVPGSESGFPMDTSRLAEEGILEWFVPPGDYTFPLLYAMHVEIYDDNGVSIPYDFMIEVIEVC